LGANLAQKSGKLLYHNFYILKILWANSVSISKPEVAHVHFEISIESANNTKV